MCHGRVSFARTTMTTTTTTTMATAALCDDDIQEIAEKLDNVDLLGKDKDSDLNNYESTSSASSSSSREETEAAATRIVDDLMRFRDRYFESHAMRDAHRKKGDVAEEIVTALKKLESLSRELNAIGRQALYLTLRGRINNANQSYSEDAFQDLSKAIKLDPTLSDAWNALGECYWYKSKMDEARNCFEGSIKLSKNKFALRNMSIVMRQLLPADQEAKLHVIKASVDNAKEAVSLDTNDGMSWYILGTAHLSLFFISNQNPKVLRQCLSAYAQAEKDLSVRNLPDLHYNRAMAFKHMEEYKNAITGFHTALCLEPEWKESAELRDDILTFLQTIQDHVTTRGKIKGKKLTAFVNGIKPEVALGPFAGGSYVPHTGKAVDLLHIPFAQLEPGDNANKVVLGKVTSSVTSGCITAFAFTMVDAEKSCVAVTLYNTKAGIGVIIGDTVAIAEPFMERVNFEFDPDCVDGGAGGGVDGTAGSEVAASHGVDDVSKKTWKDVGASSSKRKFEFVSLRVPTPVVVVVNGKKWGKDKEAFTELKVNIQPMSLQRST